MKMAHNLELSSRRIFSEMSSAMTECVSAPLEMKSTPVAAMALTLTLLSINTPRMALTNGRLRCRKLRSPHEVMDGNVAKTRQRSLEVREAQRLNYLHKLHSLLQHGGVHSVMASIIFH